jgi:hypothetical protein
MSLQFIDVDDAILLKLVMMCNRGGADSLPPRHRKPKFQPCWEMLRDVELLAKLERLEVLWEATIQSQREMVMLQ